MGEDIARRGGQERGRNVDVYPFGKSAGVAGLATKLAQDRSFAFAAVIAQEGNARVRCVDGLTVAGQVTPVIGAREQAIERSHEVGQIAVGR